MLVKLIISLNEKKCQLYFCLTPTEGRGSDLEWAIWQFLVGVVLVGMNRPKFIYELLHCHPVSGATQPIHFLKAYELTTKTPK